MQNKKNFQNIYDDIMNSHYILLVTHKNPDADTISSALSLSNYFFENKIKHKVFNISSVLPRKLDYLIKFDKITKDMPKYYDLVIYLDCANKDRVGVEVNSNIKSISIDHHQSNSNFADINIVDYSKGSTAELVYSFFKENNLNISKNVAECLYTGIYDDSLGFTASRTDLKTFDVIRDLLNSNIDVSYISNKLMMRESLSKFRILPKILNTLELFYEGKLATVYLNDSWLIETGATKDECDDIVDQVLSIGIVEIALYFRVVGNSVRVSLRSKGKIDVSKIAILFDGGGHQNSAGVSISSSNIESAKKELVKTILNYI